MNTPRSTRGQTLPSVAVALGAIAVIVAAAAIVLSRPAAPASAGASPTPTPGVASPAPSAPASPTPTATPSPAPSGPPSSVRLESTSGHDVDAVLDDQTGTLIDAESGHPGDGMSVRWHDSIVEQVAPNAVRITWVAFPDDAAIDLGILQLDGPLSIAIVQRGPVPYSDALGEDRVIVLRFSGAVDADAIDVKVIDKMID